MSIRGQARRYIVDTRAERRGKWPPFRRHTSRVKARKRARCKAKRRG
jgi:hypothetical protein